MAGNGTGHVALGVVGEPGVLGALPASGAGLPLAPEAEAPLPLSAAEIPLDEFKRMRRENLGRWPTGGEVDLDEAVQYHRALPRHKQLTSVMHKADAEGRCLTGFLDLPPRGKL